MEGELRLILDVSSFVIIGCSTARKLIIFFFIILLDLFYHFKFVKTTCFMFQARTLELFKELSFGFRFSGIE